MFENSGDDPIRRFQAEMEQVSRRAEELRPIVNSCNDAIARSGCKASLRVREGVRPTIEIFMFAKALDESVSLIRELAKDGIRSRGKEFSDGQILGFIPSRIYQLTDVVCLRVILGGDTCRMEQVGVKEVPVYEMRCGHESDEALSIGPGSQP